MTATSHGDLLAGVEPSALLSNAELLHVAIPTPTGPHVTPELFTWTAGRLWIATARRTLKARSISPGDRIGAVISSGPRHVVLRGVARPLDLLDPETLLASPPEAGLAPLASIAFALKNAPHLVGLLAQGLRAVPHSPSSARMFVAIRPIAAAFVDDGGAVSHAGAWDAATSAAVSDPAGRADVIGVPDAALDLAHAASRAVVAISTTNGPVALPSAWDADRWVATVDGRLLALTGEIAEQLDAAVELEAMDGFLMQGKRGVLLRGPAEVRRRGPIAEIALDPDRVTYWEGVDTESKPVATSRPA